MNTSLFKPLKRNGTTLYVFPSVAEDKNFESQTETYKMSLSHFVLLNIPKQVIGGALDVEGVFDPVAGYQNTTSIAPANFKDALVESLRNYVANHEAVIRNSKISASSFYYDTFEPNTTSEKIFWKWAKKLGIIEFETADPIQDYFGSDPRYNDNGSTGNTDHFREYLWKERTTTIYDVTAVSLTVPVTTVPAVLPAPTAGTVFAAITLSAATTLVPDDYIILNIDAIDPAPMYSATQSRLKVVGLATTITLNDTIIVEIDSSIVSLVPFGTITDLELYLDYNRLIQYIGEITGRNNVQLPDKAYTETFALISHQHGQIPYSLWNTKADNNYKPNAQWPILASEIQAEIQGGETPTNPILTNPSGYPGDIWGHFDTTGLLYTSNIGDTVRRSGDYYGNNAATNASPTLRYPDFDGALIDGATLNLDITDYAEAVSYVYPIESFSEFCATAFNNIAPKDFEFNAILWYYTIQDTSGNTTVTATNLYGIEFLDTPDNDDLFNETMVPKQNKYVSNGQQDGSSFTFTLDTNYAIESDVEPPSFDPEKVYSLFGMELFYEALTRMTYFNDQLTTLVNSNLALNQRVNDLAGLVLNAQSLETIRNRMNNLETLINVYSTLQIGLSDTIVPRLDTTVNPPLLRLDSVDKRYGYVTSFNTKDMYNEFINVSGFTDITIVEKTVNVINGKDFLVVVNNNDNSDPTIQYDPNIVLSPLSMVIDKDLDFKQSLDVLIIPKVNTDSLTINEPINDKKLELYINYNDGVSVIKQQLGTFSLPVLKYKSAPSTYAYEPLVGMPDNMGFNVRNVFYAMSSSNERLLSFVVDGDLINVAAATNPRMTADSRTFISNMLLEENPSTPLGTYADLSSQYAVDAISYLLTNVVDVEIVTSGTGYTANTRFLITNIEHDPLYNPVVTPSYGTDIEITTDTAGKVVSAIVVRGSNVATPTTVDTPLVIDDATLTTSVITDATDITATPILLVGSGCTLRLITKTVTRVNVAFNINADAEFALLATAYDAQFNISALPVNTYIDLGRYVKFLPSITFLRGYKISLTRISDVAVTPVTLIDQRYKIDITHF